MSAAARELARPDAADAVADLVLAVALRRVAARRGRDRGRSRARAAARRVTRPPAAPAFDAARDRHRHPAPARRQDRPRRARSPGSRRCASAARPTCSPSPTTRSSCAALIRFARARAIPFLVLGRGSNLVIADAGFRGLVIQARAEGARVDGDRYHADAGVPMARAATETQEAGLTGLEFGLAIPGTVGGAVWANAGAHGAETASVLESATLLLADGSEAVVPAAELGFTYRHSRLKDAEPARLHGPGRDRAGARRSGSSPPSPRRSRRRLDEIRTLAPASTSRWASRRRGPCSATRTATRPAG